MPKKKYPPTNPWHYTKHDYLTPEDIQAAINAGGSKLEVWYEVLKAVDMGACEDMSCCAFVAHRFEVRHYENDNEAE